MTTVILLVLGAVVGSFLNVVGLRWDSKNFGGRSYCVSCQKTLRLWELVPILSFIFLKKRCARCKTPISWQYPIIEIWTGLIFLSIFNLEFSIFNKLILILVFCIYVVITIYDFHHKIIPDELVYIAIAISALLGYSNWLTGIIIFSFFASIWLISRGRAMGFGDAKLGLSIGLLLGASLGFSAIILSFWIGALFGISYMIFSHKKITIKSEIPFAPFMIMGAWLSIIFNLDLLHVSIF